MCRKLLSMATFIIVLTTAGVIHAELVAHWKLDESSGDVVHDLSGHGNDGTFVGNPQWMNGKIGGALELNGSSSYVEIPFSESLRVINRGDFSFAAWFMLYEVPTEYKTVFQQADDASGGPGRTWLLVHQSNDIRSSLGGAPTSSGMGIEGGVWYHGVVVVTEGGDTDSVQLYINGEAAGAPREDSMEDSEGVFYIGAHKALGNIWDGLLDDIRIYNHALTETQILAAMEGDQDFPYAFGPNPPDGALHPDTWVNLSWSPGDYAVSHDVYLGDNFDDVDNGTGDTFRGNQTTTIFLAGFPGFAYPDGLVPGMTYYWRVDEFDAQGNTSKGPLWIFTTGSFLLVDDFESYTDDDAAGEAIWQTWIDGFGAADNGAQVGYLLPPYAEQTIVHGGSQSMPLLYTNEAGVTNSEAALTLTTPRDWTQAGITELSFWFRGASGNTAEPLYIAISNSAGAPAILAHDDPDAATARSWTQWNIPLQTFTDQGLNLTNVDKIAIGLGSKSGVAIVGGSGTMYFDDVRLYTR